MPYGVPTLNCPSCGKELGQYRPFCWHCGAAQSPEVSEQQLEGAFELPEIRAELERTRGWEALVWSYSCSHSELEIRLQGRPGENVHVVCASTRAMRFDATAWLSGLEVEFDDESGRYVLRDRAAGVEVVCRMLSTVRRVPPVY
jgi:hypothetical protein